MIGLLRGTIFSVSTGQVILDVGGVGYAVHVPTSRDQEVILGQELVLYTYLSVREDALTLFGFTTESEKEVFELLISVSGVGPRLGLAILSAFSPIEIQSAISTNKPEVFTSVSGIGKKNAERIILDLKNKIALPGEIDNLAMSDTGELTAALSALGYSMAEAIKAGQQVDTSLPLSEQVKSALAVLAKNN